MTDITLIEGYVDKRQSCLYHEDMPELPPVWVPPVIVRNIELSIKFRRTGDLFDE